jgi:predicted PurR-regulated permease PerM
MPIRKDFKQLFQDTKERMKRMRERLVSLKQEQKRLKNPFFEAWEDEKRPKHPTKKTRMVVEFSPASVAKATLVVIALVVLGKLIYEIREILILLFVALFLSAALDSIVNNMAKRRIPRAVSVILIYIVFSGLMVAMISTFIPLVATQTLELAKTVGILIANLSKNEQLWSLPYTESLREWITEMLSNVDQDTLIANLQTGLEQVGKQLQNIAGNTLGAVKVLFDSLFNAILVMVMTFFLIVDENGVEKFLISLFPSKHGKYIIEKSIAIKENIGSWLRGQLKLMVLIGVVTFVGLTVLGVEYAATLALIAGMTELVPVVGPLIAMVPALLIGLNDSVSQAFWILVLYVVIQQAEGNIIVPMVMKKAVGLDPIVVVLSMMIGYTFLGVLGVIISVPVATALAIFIKDYTRKSK